MKLQKMKHGSYFVILPKQFILLKGWQKGEKLECKIDEKGDLVIKK